MTSTSIHSLKRFARAGLIVLTLGGATVAAMPAQATNYQNPQFSFSLNFGNGGQFTVTNHRTHRPYCAPLPRVRQAFRNHGYFNISFGHQNGPWVIVYAQKGRWQYTYRVNRCTWQVIQIDRHRIRHHGGGWPNNPGWNWN